MVQALVKKYIGCLTLEHVIDYAKEKNIILTLEEAQILYHFIQRNYLGLLEDNTTILELKKLIRDDLYEKVFSLYQKNKTKYL